MGILGAIGSIVGGLAQANAAKQASKAQSNAAQQQLDFNKQIYTDQTKNFAPWLQSGQQGMQAYNSLLGLGAAPAGFTGYQQSPGYQFQLAQGLDAAKSAAAAHGGLGNGSTLQALNNYGQGMANQDYQTYLNRLQGVSAAGQSAAGMQSQAAQQYGQNGLSAMGSMGDARAAGIMGASNALAGGINNAISGFGYMQGNGGNNGGLGGMFAPGGIFAPTSGGMAPRPISGGMSGG